MSDLKNLIKGEHRALQSPRLAAIGQTLEDVPKPLGYLTEDLGSWMSKLGHGEQISVMDRIGAASTALDAIPNPMAKVGLMGLGTIAPILRNQGRSFIGPRLDEAADPKLIQAFYQQKKKGLPMKEITRDTGIFEASDGRLMTQFSDVDAKPRPQFTQAARQAIENRGSASRILEDVYDHPEFYKRYPEVGEKTVVRFDGRSKNSTGGSVEIDVSPNGDLKQARINVYLNSLDGFKDSYNLGSRNEAAKNIMTHEMQHIVQAIEGMQKGISQEDIIKAMQPEQIAADLQRKKEMKRALALMQDPDSARGLEIQKAIKDIDVHVELMGAMKDIQEKTGMTDKTFGYTLYMRTRGEQDARWAAFMMDNPHVAEEVPAHLHPVVKQHVGYGNQLFPVSNELPSFDLRPNTTTLSRAE